MLKFRAGRSETKPTGKSNIWGDGFKFQLFVFSISEFSHNRGQSRDTKISLKRDCKLRGNWQNVWRPNHWEVHPATGEWLWYMMYMNICLFVSCRTILYIWLYMYIDSMVLFTLKLFHFHSWGPVAKNSCSLQRYTPQTSAFKGFWDLISRTYGLIFCQRLQFWYSYQLSTFSSKWQGFFGKNL